MDRISEDQAMLALRALYESYGYARFKMGRFEEYDLYVRNKDFLVSDQVITFTDRSGRLLALKPDVTLSIIKNAEPQGVRKVYYNENVYRVAPGSETFQEITQVGLECVGQIGDYEIAETVVLAVKSLSLLGKPFALELSHMGLVSAVLDGAGIPQKEKKNALRCIQSKSRHELERLCGACGADGAHAALLLTNDLDAIGAALTTEEEKESFASFERLWKVLQRCGVAGRIRIDFSVGSDMKYYCGAVFKGYLEGIPTGVLSGGQYDRLLTKMGRSGGAIGFAIYASLLERLYEKKTTYDVDTVLLYGDSDDPADVLRARESLGNVLAAKSYPQGMRWRRLMKMENGEAVLLEDNG